MYNRFYFRLLIRVISILLIVSLTNHYYSGYSAVNNAFSSTVVADTTHPPLISENTSNIQTNNGDNHNTSSNFTLQKNVLPNLFEKVENSVVQITSRVSDINPNVIINGSPVERQSVRLGSGFVYDNKGHIISNNHVVEGSKTVDVTFVDGNIYSANVIGKDAYSDLSVLQIEHTALSKETLKPLLLANSTNLQVGQEIVSIGNPFGLSGSMTHGIISQINRLLPQPDLGFTIPGYNSN